MTEAIRYCVACAHFRPSPNHRGMDAVRFGRCHSPQAHPSVALGYEGTQWVAPGAEMMIQPRASSMRNQAKYCGPGGYWFEVAQTEPSSQGHDANALNRAIMGETKT